MKREQRSTYKQIEKHLASCLPFTGSSLWAAGDPNTGVYSVYSYGTLIATVRRDGATGRLHRWIASERFSATTSRGQGLCRKKLPGIPEKDLTPEYHPY